MQTLANFFYTFGSMSTRIVSYNVNGIRAALRKGLLDWIQETDIDVLCIQETKAQPDQIDLSALTDLGYHDTWHSAERKGYSGVLTLSKFQPKQIHIGMDIPEIDSEGRVLRTDFEGFTLLNCYFPSGSSSEERHAFKMSFLERFRPYVIGLLESCPHMIIVGDYNVVHLDLDIHNPERKDKPSGFRPEERQWMDDFFEVLFVDAFRQKEPTTPDIYSWWSYRAASRARNKGWRIDYAAVTPSLAPKIQDARYLSDAVHSDHCPLLVDLDL